MRGLVLSGGRGTRLTPLTYRLTNQLIPVENHSAINFVIKHLKKAKIKAVEILISPETGD